MTKKCGEIFFFKKNVTFTLIDIPSFFGTRPFFCFGPPRVLLYCVDHNDAHLLCAVELAS